MSRRANRIVLLLVVCVAVLATFARWATAQAPGQPKPFIPLLTEQPAVLSGSDLGFRIGRWDDQIPVGQLVVKVNGVWQDAQLSK
jgi:hypothetical protein